MRDREVGVESRRSEDATADERLRRAAQILGRGAVRLARARLREKNGPPRAGPEEQALPGREEEGDDAGDSPEKTS